MPQARENRKARAFGVIAGVFAAVALITALAPVPVMYLTDRNGYSLCEDLSPAEVSSPEYNYHIAYDVTWPPIVLVCRFTTPALPETVTVITDIETPSAWIMAGALTLALGFGSAAVVSALSKGRGRDDGTAA